jgi:hypothetical protein
VPFKSKKQQKFAYANPEKFGGQEGLNEWSSDTNFSSLPETVNSERKKKFTFAPRTQTRASYTRDQRVA